LLGLSNGYLLGFDPFSLELTLADQIFTNGDSIDFIEVQPASMIIIGSKKNKEIVSYCPIKKESHYLYVEIEDQRYATVEIPETHLLNK
jgi:hypothetical protein